VKLYGKCEHCKEEFSFRSYSQTRVDFAMNEGKIKRYKCLNCNNLNEIHVNELKAKESKIAQIIAAIILLLGTPILMISLTNYVNTLLNLYYILIGGFLLLPVVVYGIILKQERNRVNHFNRHKL